MRQLGKYPYNENKLKTLMRSIGDVGLWEGIIVRRSKTHPALFEQAFGHHRLEAGKRKLGGETPIPVIVRDDLSDEQMLRFMGRENLEDYNAYFLVMLETWDAAVAFDRGRDQNQKVEDIRIARLIGWMSGRHVNATAEACSHASQLITGGYMTRDDLIDLSVRAVRELCAEVVAEHNKLEELGRVTNRPEEEVAEAKKVVGNAGKTVADGIRKGRVAQRDIRSEVEDEAYDNAKAAKIETPLFRTYGNKLCNSLLKVLNKDKLIEKLEQIESALGQVELEEDVQVVRRVSLECKNLADRAARWHTKLDQPRDKIVKFPLRAIKGPDAAE